MSLSENKSTELTSILQYSISHTHTHTMIICHCVPISVSVLCSNVFLFRFRFRYRFRFRLLCYFLSVVCGVCCIFIACRFGRLRMIYQCVYLWMLLRVHRTMPAHGWAAAMRVYAWAIRTSVSWPYPKWVPRTYVPNSKGNGMWRRAKWSSIAYRVSPLYFRLYTQLEILKNKTLRQDNPHISKRRGGRKAGHRRFSLQVSDWAPLLDSCVVVLLIVNY